MKHVKLLFFAIALGALFSLRIQKVTAEELMEDPVLDGDEINLPDLSHQLLAVHAAESHGNSPQQVDWISQGAYDEDHQPIPTFGWHSWDPDTGEYWWSPFGDGPALERANMLFQDAVALYSSDEEGAWLIFGQSLHLLQDLSTPAHAHADSHACLGGVGDCDAYETWLGGENLAKTMVWLDRNPPDPFWNSHYLSIPTWEDLSPDLQNQLEAANLEYGGYSNGEDLWILGPVGIDPILFQLMFLMAENADDFNSGGLIEFPGEVYNGDLHDPHYLEQMRDTLFPIAIKLSTMWIDYFEVKVGIQRPRIYLPFLYR